MNNLSTLSSTVSFLASTISPVIAMPESRLYPFVGAKACKVAIESDFSVVKATLALLAHTNSFMSSQVKVGKELAAIAIADDDAAWTYETVGKATKIAASYSKKLSVVLRDHAMAQDPTLVAYAATFSVKPSAV